MCRCRGSVGSVVLLSLLMLLLTHASTVPIKVTEVDECCRATSSQRITGPITGCWFQKAKGPCVSALIFSSEGQQYCISPKSSWVPSKIRELWRKKMFCSLKLDQQPTVVVSGAKH